MATIKTYSVRRAGFAPKKGGGEVYITRQNQDQIPELLSQATIRERVQAGSLIEHDTGVEATDQEAADQLEVESGVEVESPARGARRRKER